MPAADKTPSIEKEIMLNQLLKTLEGSNYIFFAKFKGISSSDINELRRKLDKSAERVVAVKNSLAKIVLERINAQDAFNFLEGQVLMTTGKNEPQVVSKILVDFAKDKENFELKGVFIDQKVFQKQFVKDLAALPSKEQLIASVVGGIKGPINGFVLGLGQVLRSLVNVLDQVQKSKV